MFRYQDNGKVSKPSEIQRKVVTHVRKVTYINPGKKIEKDKDPENVVTEGYEPVREAVVSPEFTCIPVIVGNKTVMSPNLLNRQDD